MMPWRLWRRWRVERPPDHGNGATAAAARARAEARLRATRAQQREVARLVDSLGEDIEQAMRRRGRPA